MNAEPSAGPGLSSTARINLQAMLQVTPLIRDVTVEDVASHSRRGTREFGTAIHVGHSYGRYHNTLRVKPGRQGGLT